MGVPASPKAGLRQLAPSAGGAPPHSQAAEGPLDPRTCGWAEPAAAWPRLSTLPSPPPAPVQGAPKEVVDPSSGRATLLESIRQAGGIGKAKLRSVKERKLEKKKQKEQEHGERPPRPSRRARRKGTSLYHPDPNRVSLATQASEGPCLPRAFAGNPGWPREHPHLCCLGSGFLLGLEPACCRFLLEAGGGRASPSSNYRTESPRPLPAVQAESGPEMVWKRDLDG